jgi:lipoprotein-anchoring transpeptidase ErfK/SrfK
MSLTHRVIRGGLGRPVLHRRAFMFGAAGAALAGCTVTTEKPELQYTALTPQPDPYYVKMYAAISDEKIAISAVDISKIDPRYLRQEVSYSSDEQPGTIIVDTQDKFLYLVQESGRALRYGVGVGREGFDWDGRATIQMKRKWPTWTPPRSMIEREPELEKYANGMPPGLDNPLGARALYLFKDGRDTLYRLHGTNEPWSIGKAVSSGCIRLFNQDIIDLYNRTPLGTPVVVPETRRAPDLLA